MAEPVAGAGNDGRLQDRAQNFASRKQAAAHAAQMREIERRGIGDPHRHDSPATCADGWRTIVSAATWRRPRCAATSATPRWRRDTAGMSCSKSSAVAISIPSMPSCDARRPAKRAPAAAVTAKRDARPPALHGALRQAVKWR